MVAEVAVEAMRIKCVIVRGRGGLIVVPGGTLQCPYTVECPVEIPGITQVLTCGHSIIWGMLQRVLHSLECLLHPTPAGNTLTAS